MKIFITGSSGFIGSHLVKFLRRKYEVLEFKGDLKNISRWKLKLKKFKPDVAVHLAWEGIPVFSPELNRKNLKNSLNLIEALGKVGCKKFIGIGTCMEYGVSNCKLKESDFPSPANPLGAVKNLLRILGSDIARNHKMKFVWVRIFYVFGPGQRSGSLIPSLIENFKNGIAPELKNPNAANDYIYIDDVISALGRVIAVAKSDYAVYNIGSGKLTSNYEIASIIAEFFKKNYSKFKKEKRYGFWADISKMQKEISWRPKVSVKEGIIKTIKAGL